MSRTFTIHELFQIVDVADFNSIERDNVTIAQIHDFAQWCIMDMRDDYMRISQCNVVEIVIRNRFCIDVVCTRNRERINTIQSNPLFDIAKY